MPLPNIANFVPNRSFAKKACIEDTVLLKYCQVPNIWQGETQMKRVLMTSGYPKAVIKEVSRRWKVIHIPDQREALEYLKSCCRMPQAALIGNVPGPAMKKDFDAKTLLREIHKLDAQIPVIISTHQQSPRVIVDFIKQGAFDYVIEPSDLEDPQISGYIQDLIFALTRAIAWGEVTRENQKLKENLIGQNNPDFIKGRSAGILRVIELIRKVAPTPANVLITGESGTGKELVARAIHGLSSYKEGPFTPLNCGAISENLLASELFGHVKGAFTGAETSRPGLICETGSGTLFLDEIGTVAPAFQVMLLRVLEQRTARPVGGNSDYQAKCRFVSAANCDLEKLVAQHKFREDLFYRLNVFHIHIPPLRQRQEDIPILTDFFLRESARQFGKPVKGISPSVMELFEEYSWPGNVRQLRNVLERAVILCEGEMIGVGDVDSQVRSQTKINNTLPDNIGFDKAMQQFERSLILSALAQAKGNRSQAARILGIKRTTLNYRIKQLDIE